ncbi:MAG: hypothetical protein ACLR5S_04330 [Ruminococcus sp.]
MLDGSRAEGLLTAPVLTPEVLVCDEISMSRCPGDFAHTRQRRLVVASAHGTSLAT